VIEGRKTYANIIKYIKMTASSNFGNMFSVLAASAFLPFLPMTPVQILLLNLIYDVSCLAVPWDNVDEDYLRVPRTWDASSISKFMVWIGPSSSVFDITTFRRRLPYPWGSGTGKFCGAVPCGMVCGIPMDADACHPHDPHAAHAVCEEPGVVAAHTAHLHRHCGGYGDPLYHRGQGTWHDGHARQLFYSPAFHDPGIYGACDGAQETVYPKVWRIAVRRRLSLRIKAPIHFLPFYGERLK